MRLWKAERPRVLDRAAGWIRASAFGAIEGLVGNTMLVTATAAAAGPEAAVLAGIVGALSNPASHAVGEFLSVGDETAAKQHAGHGHGHGAQGQAHVTAALASIASAGLGAAIPVIPFALGASSPWWGLAAGGLGLLGTGVASSVVTKRPWWQAGLRYLGAGALTGGLSYAGVESVSAISENPWLLIPAITGPALAAVGGRAWWRRHHQHDLDPHDHAGNDHHEHDDHAHSHGELRESVTVLPVPTVNGTTEALQVRLRWGQGPNQQWYVREVEASDLRQASARLAEVAALGVTADDPDTALWADSTRRWVDEVARERRPHVAAALLTRSFANAYLPDDDASHLVSAARECHDEIDRRLLGWSNPQLLAELARQSRTYEISARNSGTTAHAALGIYQELAEIARAAGHPTPPVESFHPGPAVQNWARHQPGGAAHRRSPLPLAPGSDRVRTGHPPRSVRETRYAAIRARLASGATEMSTGRDLHRR